MRKMQIGKRMPVFLFFLMMIGLLPFAGGRLVSFADKTSAQNPAANAADKKNQLEQERKKTQDILNQLSGLKSDTAAYVKKLDESLNSVSAEVDSLNGKISGTEKEISATEAKLKNARDTSSAQYDAMKLRIKYMYEKGSTSYLDLLFSAKDITELLNRAEYVEKISEYDREQFTEYEKTCDTISAEEEKLKNDRENLVGLKDQAEIKQDSLETLLAGKKTELAGYETKIGSAKTNLSDYDKQIKAQEDEIKAIEAEVARKEEEARKAAAAKAAEESRAAAEAASKAAAEAGKNAAKTTTASSSSKTKTAAAAQKIGNIKFLWPCPSGSSVSSGFGGRSSPTEGASSNHMGIDIPASTGSAVLAAADGEVVVSTYSPSAGNYIMLSHGGGTFTLYMHCSALNVSEGQSVKAGQTIGKVGSTGYSTGPHLHFAIRTGGKYVNPANYVKP
jgi:murein DD-endopeptidase MepM/ murein hydrolase activator NlpD